MLYNIHTQITQSRLSVRIVMLILFLSGFKNIFAQVAYLPIPSSGNTYEIAGWQYNPDYVIVGNFDGDTQLDFAIKTKATSSNSSKIEVRNYNGNLLWQFDTQGTLEQMQDSYSPDHEPFIAWDMDQDGIDELLTVQFRGPFSSHEVYFVMLDGTTGAIRGEIHQPIVIDLDWESRRYACIAYLDGPSGVPYFCVGTGIYQEESYVFAFFWNGSNLELKWTYNHQTAYPGAVSSGTHELGSFDVDNDGKDEVLFGGTCINNNGTGRWSLSQLGDWRHEDIMQYGDLYPSNPGNEVVYGSESPGDDGCTTGIIMVDASTGSEIWSYPGNQLEKGWVGNYTNDHPGCEVRMRSSPDDCGQCCVDIYLKSDGTDIGSTFPNEEGHPYDWNGDDLYEWSDGLLGSWAWAADLTNPSENHGAEETIWPDASGKKVTVHFNKNANSYPSRWENLHYQQDVQRISACGHARWHTIPVVHGTCDANNQLTVNVSPAGGGTVTPASGTMYCDNTVVQLTASPNIGYMFDSWSGDISGSANPTNITMSSNKTVTANFSPAPQYTLTVNTSGSGSVTLNPSGGTYDASTVVTLTATPDAGSQFDNWTGDLTGTVNPETITMDSNKNVTANFSEAPPVDVYDACDANIVTGKCDTIHAGYTGAGFADTDNQLGTYVEWTNVYVSETKSYNCTIRFANGSAADRTTDIEINGIVQTSLTFEVTGAWPNWSTKSFSVDLNAGTNTFSVIGTNAESCPNIDKLEVETGPPPPQYTLTVNTTGSGSVALDPTGGTYDSGTVVTLTATPDAGNQFDNWTGDLVGTVNPETITMDADKTVTANFSPLPQYTLTVNTAGSGSVSLDPTGGTYESGIVVTLMAAPNAGNQFDNWSGDLTGTANPETITMDSDKTVTANFSPLPQYTLTVNTSGPGSVSLDPPGGTYDSGTVVTLTATPDAGYQFDNWTGDLTGATNPETITMDADKTVTANFSEIPQIVVYDGCDANIVTGSCDNNHAGYTGAGFANTSNSGGVYVEWTNVTSSATQSCNCTIRFANGTGQARPADVEINGIVQTSLSFESTGQWSSWVNKAFSVTLNAGSNNFRVIGTGPQGCPNIDKLEVESGPPPTQYTLTVNTSGNGSVSLNPSGGIYNEGTVVTLTANPDAGNQFDNWTGDLAGTANPESITMDADKTVTANFSVIQYTLTVNTSGNGSVSLNPAGGTYDSGTVVTLTATPDAGNQFDIWTGDLTGTANPATITMDANKTVTASFSVIQYTLTVNTSGNGSVSLNPPGGTYNTGTVVTLTATPDAENQFDNWAGDLTGTANPATITMDANKTVTANFSVIQYTLTVNTSGNGSVSLNPPGDTYNSGTVVTLTATPDAGNQFDNWTGDLTGTVNPATITMDANKTVTANFSLISQYTLTVNVSGSGSVTLNPSGGTYDEGTVVTLTSTPDAGNQFDNWTGDLTGTVNPATITMDANKTVTANFSAVPQYTLTVNVSGSGSISLNPPGGTYDSGTIVTLTATPDAGNQFDNWSGDLTGTSNPETITMDVDKNVTAVFSEIPGEQAFLQDSGADGIVSMEVEHYDDNVSQGGHDWTVNMTSGYSGDSAMEATPNDGISNNTGYAANSPRMDFKVDFVKTGTHYIWARGIGASEFDDSYHAGLDGQEISTCDRCDGFGTTWAWSKHTMDAADATFEVTSTGVHTVNVWMREDGFIIDKLVLTVNSSYTPSGTGPAESPRSGGEPPAQYNLTVNTSGSGSVSLNPPGGTYDSGTVVTLTATPDPSNQFDNWTGDLTGTVNPETITMDADKTVTANFSAVPQYTLTVNTAGSGSVTLNPPGGTYNTGTVVTLTATPDAGNQFDNWTGDLTGTVNPGTITMDADKTVTANFSPVPQYTLTVNTVGSGSVSLNPTGGTYDSGTVVTLTATPDAGWSFDNWSGDLTGVANPENITMDADKTVTATFIEGGVPADTIEVRISVDDDDVEERNGSSMAFGSSDLELCYDGSTPQKVGMRFNSVNIPQGAPITNAYIQFQCDETGSSATNLTVHGEAADNASVFTTTSGDISARELTTASTAWNNVPAWNTAGEAGPNQRTPDISSIIQEIVNRSGWASGNALVLIVSGTGTRTAEAHNGDPAGAPLLHVEFGGGPPPPQYNLTVNTVGSGSVSLNPSGGTYNTGTVVTLTATSDTGNQFDNWSGDLSGSANPETITMDADKNVTATFSEISGEQAFQQDSGSDGIVSIEAEHYDDNVSQGGYDWTSNTTGGYSGDGAMEATPNTGACNNTNYAANSPRMDFKVNFVKTGTHYIWARGIGPSVTDDSYHAGLNGQEISTCDRIGDFNTSWGWLKSTMDGPDATFEVTSTGVHTVNVWMREDGFIIDKLVLTVSSSYTPSGTGPAESSRGPAKASQPAVETVETEQLEVVIPDELTLVQNFPNPFNPSTTITYGLPQASHVRLTVYDMNGRLVSMLVNDVQNAGEYRHVWEAVDPNGNQLPSGMYLCRFQAGAHVETIKMMFMR